MKEFDQTQFMVLHVPFLYYSEIRDVKTASTCIFNSANSHFRAAARATAKDEN